MLCLLAEIFGLVAVFLALRMRGMVVQPQGISV